MGTPSSQAEIGFWVQAPRALLRDPGALSPDKILKLHVQHTAFWSDNGSQYRSRSLWLLRNNANGATPAGKFYENSATSHPINQILNRF